MPWKESRDQRLQFLSSYQKEEMSFSDLCREFGVTAADHYPITLLRSDCASPSRLTSQELCLSATHGSFAKSDSISPSTAGHEAEKGLAISKCPTSGRLTSRAGSPACSAVCVYVSKSE